MTTSVSMVFESHGWWEMLRCAVSCVAVHCTGVLYVRSWQKWLPGSAARLKRTSECTGAPQSNVSCKTCRFWWRWDLVHFSLWHQWRIVLTVAEFRFNGNVTVEVLGSHRRTLPSGLCPILHPGTCPPLFPRAWKGVEGIWSPRPYSQSGFYWLELNNDHLRQFIKCKGKKEKNL